METFKRPAEPPSTGKKKKPRQYKSPLEMSVFLIQQCWLLFETIWETRNELLHSADSYAAEAQNSIYFERLLFYKKYVNRLLHCGDRHHVDYPVGVIASWDRKKKKKVVRLLDRLHKIYLQDCKLEADGQKKLTGYGFTVYTPDLDESLSS